MTQQFIIRGKCNSIGGACIRYYCECHDTAPSDWELVFKRKFTNDGSVLVRQKKPTPWMLTIPAQQVINFIRSVEHAAILRTRESVNENTSDGYHTFKELYEFRLLYNAALFNEWAAQGKYDVHKSQRHADGELCFGRDDYFVVVATLPTGQISNHYPMSDWELFKCEAVEKAKSVWDGHTPQDVAHRLRTLLSSLNQESHE